MREEFLNAIRSGDRERAEELLEENPGLASSMDEQGVPVLLVALYHRQPELAASIRKHRTDLGLFEAAATGDLDRVRTLLDRDPSLVTAYSPDGWTALHLASFFGHARVVALLLDRGAGIDMLSASMGNTALQAATANGQADVVRLLIDRNADVGYATAQGEFTALHGAANAGNVPIARMLLEAGADPEAKTTDGRTARELAEGKHPAIIELLDELTSSESEDA